MTGFDDTNGTQTRNDDFNTFFRRLVPYKLTRDNSGFTPTYAVQPSGHMAFVLIGVALFVWLLAGNGIKDIKKHE